MEEVESMASLCPFSWLSRVCCTEFFFRGQILALGNLGLALIMQPLGLVATLHIV